MSASYFRQPVSYTAGRLLDHVLGRERAFQIVQFSDLASHDCLHISHSAWGAGHVLNARFSHDDVILKANAPSASETLQDLQVGQRHK
jgi:hypothetical protein